MMSNGAVGMWVYGFCGLLLLQEWLVEKEKMGWMQCVCEDGAAPGLSEWPV